MAENLTTLGIEISTVGIKAASKAIDDLTDSAKKVEVQIEKTESSIVEMERAEKTLVPQTQKVKKELDGVTNSAKKVDVELDKTRVGVIDLNRAEAALVTQTDKVSNELDELSQSASRASTATGNANKNLNNLGNSSNVVKGKFGAMKGATQNVSYQLQDIAVQAQMGTSAFIILGQQGPQLASIFGPGGAVLGAFIAFASMIGGVLYNSMQSAKVTTEELDEALKRLNNTVIKTEDSTHLLSEEILALARASSVAAIAELTSQLVDSNTVIAEAKKGIEGFASAALGVDFRQLPSMLAAVNDEASKFPDMPMGRQQQDLASQVETSLKKLKDDYKLGAKDAQEFFDTVSKLDSKDVSTYDNLGVLLDRLVISFGEAADKDLVKLRREVGDTAKQMKLAADQAGILSKGIGLVSVGGANTLAPLVKGTAEAAEKLRKIDEDSLQRSLELEMRETKSVDDKTAKLKKASDKQIADALVVENADKARINNLLEADIKEGELAQAKLDREKILAQSRLDSIMLAGTTEYEAIKLIEDAKQAKLKEDYAKKLIDLEEFEAAQTQIEKTADADRLAYRLAAEQMAYQTAGAFAGKITALMAGAFGEQSAAAKAAYVVQQGLAIAQTIVATEMAAITAGAQASVLTGVAGFLGSASMVRAMGYASVAIIAGQTIGSIAGGRALGGQVRGGESYLVGERGPELLTMGTSGRIATNENLKNAVGGGGGVTVINNIDATGSGPDVETKIKAAMDQTSAKTIATIQDLMRRRRFA